VHEVIEELQVTLTPVTRDDVTFKTVGKYTYDLISLAGKRVELYPNHDTKLSSSELVAKYRCESATSGSFYGLDDRPIGLFISEGRQIQSESSSDLFIGFVKYPFSRHKVFHSSFGYDRLRNMKSSTVWGSS
jgi:hypothetical protein